MADECDWELVGQDVVLGFEIWSVECKDTVKRRWAWMRGEYWMVLEELGEAVGGQGMLGRDIEAWA